MKEYVIEPKEPAQACMIWMHGLGADPQNMLDVAQQLSLNVPTRHVSLEAPVRPVTINNRMPMRAWYDIVGLDLTDREDDAGILASQRIIEQAIQSQMTQGLRSQQIFLSGFSQGGAMSLFVGLKSALPLGGIVSLSAYLPFSSQFHSVAHPATPVFMALGQQDMIVYPRWTKQTYERLQKLQIQDVALHEYPMEHSVCFQEIRDLSQWLNHRVVKMTDAIEQGVI